MDIDRLNQHLTLSRLILDRYEAVLARGSAPFFSSAIFSSERDLLAHLLSEHPERAAEINDLLKDWEFFQSRLSPERN